MSTETTIRVNFGKPMPLFPLNTTSLMPHQILPLNIFEPRYVQMIEDALDGPGQIAMGVFEGRRWMQEYHGRPPVRRAACVGQIIQHMKVEDGRYAVILQGVCRARIEREVPPGDERLYRMVYLEPIGIEPPDEAQLATYREHLTEALTSEPLNSLRGASSFVEHLRREEVPTSAIMELLALTFVSDHEVRYQLLEAADARERAQIVSAELLDLAKLLAKAAPQRKLETPKGVSWN